jgi:hypothetical protein
VSVFYKDAAGNLFRTYSAYARGIDLLNTAYNYIDLVPKGRDEGGRSQYWVRRRDEYQAPGARKTRKKNKRSAKRVANRRPAKKRTAKKAARKAGRK